MKKQIKDVYVVHHSHTDIGYTDYQERIVYNQIAYIREAIRILNESVGTDDINAKFRWNCESYFCVEQFLNEATKEEIDQFCEYVKNGLIGMSASYLNFTDLVDTKMLKKRIQEIREYWAKKGVAVKTAMHADINGISMGARDALIEGGVEFLFLNIHTHHGMYPLYKNQTPFYWVNEEGKRLLVYSGEHYHLGNRMGLMYNCNDLPYNATKEQELDEFDFYLDRYKSNLDEYLNRCYDNQYPYDFIVTSISGVFSDNAPPNTDVIRTVEAFNEKYKDEIKLHMVTLQQLYEVVASRCDDIPSYTGDLNDWWADGVGSTPYAVKQYKEAVRMYHMCERLGEKAQVDVSKTLKTAEDNLMLYAEHTWGHSSTISNPYDTMVQTLDLRKTGYSTKAHEELATCMARVKHKLGDKLTYYNHNGEIKAINLSKNHGKRVVQFYVEAGGFHDVKVIRLSDQAVMNSQLSGHPRGILISFEDTFEALEEKCYEYRKVPVKQNNTNNNHIAYMGEEGIKDVINEYDTVSYSLAHGLENEYYKITYVVGQGITSFYNKLEDREMIKEGLDTFFTPLYENTKIRIGDCEERRVVGRNIRGVHATLHQATLVDVKVITAGAVFEEVELIFELEGTFHSSIVLKMFKNLPKLEFKYKIAKTLSNDLESIFLPLSLDVSESEFYIVKGDHLMRPGMDQIPGTGMEFYMTDQGMIYKGEKSDVIIQSKDVPLIYMGDMKHHAIKLCDIVKENNQRPVYSWVMNNKWETNFKMDLSGFAEFCYSLELTKPMKKDQVKSYIQEDSYDIVTFITK